MRMRWGTLAVESVMFTLSAMSSTCVRLFGGAPALRGKRIMRSLSVGFLADPECFDAVVLSNAFPLLEVDATAT